MIKTESGKWYFFVQCVSCGEDLLFAEAPSPDAEPVVKVRGVQIDCPHCGTAHTYDAKKVGRGVKD